MYKVQDKVMYGTNGVCTISEITTKKIGREKIEYYVLKPSGSNSSTLFVPTHSEALVGKMRFIMTKDEVESLIGNIPKDKPEWVSNKNLRFDLFKSIIASGDCTEILKLIRTIHFHEDEQLSKGKRLHISDERFLKEAEKMILEEFSMVLEESTQDVLARILS